MAPRPSPRTALVTGASSGVGVALAKRLAARGVEVWLAARREADLARHVDAILAAGGKAHALPLDVSNVDATAAAVLSLDDACGGLDLVVANAGVGSAGRLISEEPWEQMRNILTVNFVGAAATLLPLVPRMKARRRGHLVGISSLQADLELPRGVTYGAAKAGLSFLLRSADVELRPFGVDVTVIHPGFMRTEMTAKLEQPMPLAMSAERAAEIMDRAIQRRARLVRFPWIMGALMRFVAGWPRWLSRPILRRAAKVPKP